MRVLGCSGAEFPGHNPSAFLVDDMLLLDAGTVGAVLREEEQLRIKHILITHPHLDHIRGIPLVADNVIIQGLPTRIDVIGTDEIIAAIRNHILNGVIWPDFSAIPSPESAVIRYVEIVPETVLSLNGYDVQAFRVNHTAPAVGYRISNGLSTLVYTGDTGPTDFIWEKTGDVSALVVEVSFPNEMEELALRTGHLTPSLLEKELQKLKTPAARIMVTHMKPQYQDRIVRELESSTVEGLEILHDGEVYEV